MRSCVAWVVVGACVVAACDLGGAEREQVRAFLARVAAVDLRAPAEERERQIAALRDVALSDPGLVRVREQCVSAHAGLLAAERAQAAARQELDRAGPSGLEQVALTRIAGDVARAGQTLRAAQAVLPECQQSVGRLMKGAP